MSVCKHRVSCSISLPSRGSFHLSLTVLISIGHQVVFSLMGWSPLLHTRFQVPRTTLDTASLISFFYRTFTFFGSPSQTILFLLISRLCSPNPKFASKLGLGSSAFARHYSQNRFFFLFLLVLRCFSSQRSPSYTTLLIYE